MPIPNETDRESILKAVMRNSPLGQDVDLREVARDLRCDVVNGRLM